MRHSLRCVECGWMAPLAAGALTCPNHDPRYGYLSVEGNKQLDEELFSDPVVDLGQAVTPLLPAPRLAARYGIGTLSIKDEGRNPTGSFKDRENFVLFNYLLKRGIREPVFVVSSGNAAVSTAAYAQKAGLRCACYVPERTSSSKKALIALYGAEVVEMPGSYEDVYNAVLSSPPQGINATPGICPLKEEGDKAIAYEIVAQTGVPDKIVVPCGNGVNLWSIFNGFLQLKERGRIHSLPQMIGVQVAGADPLRAALEQGEAHVAIAHPSDSLAEGIVASESYASPKALLAVRASGGRIVTVNDEEILDAHRDVIETESIVPEFTSSSVYAALRKLGCAPSESVVCINTGSGAKDVKEMPLLLARVASQGAGA